MSRKLDRALLLGQALVSEGLVSGEQLEAALADQSGGRLGDRLVARSDLARDDVENVVRARDDSALSLEDSLLGELAVRNGFIAREDLTKYLGAQEAAKAGGVTPPRLGEFLVAAKFLTQKDLDALLKRQKTLLKELSLGTWMRSGEQGGEGQAEATELGEEGTGADAGPTSQEASWRAATKLVKRSLVGLLQPEPADPITCQACKSAANSPLAMVCSGCGAPLTAAGGKQRGKGPLAWGLRIAFVVACGLTGFLATTLGPYVIAAAVFMFLSAGMLGRYKWAQRYSLFWGILLFSITYVITGPLGMSAHVAYAAVATSPASLVIPPVLALLIATLILPLAAPLGYGRSRSFGGALFVFTVLLCAWWVAARSLGTHVVPVWGTAILVCSALASLALILALACVEGFREAIRRPGVIIEATRPLPTPDRPTVKPSDLTHLPIPVRPLFRVVDLSKTQIILAWHHLVAVLVSFGNAAIHRIEVILDLLLRAVVRGFRRLTALAYAAGCVIAAIATFAAYAVWRVLLVVAMPVVAITASAFVAHAFSENALSYLLQGGLAFLGRAFLYAAVLFVLSVVTVALLVRCHPINVVVNEAFQAVGCHLPNLLLLFYVASIALSLLSWATGAGPFRFGLLSIAITVLLVTLLVVFLLRAKKQAVRAPAKDVEEPVDAVAEGEADGVDMAAGDDTETDTVT